MIELRDREQPRNAVERVRPDLSARSPTPTAPSFIVNDDPHLAAELRADGVHLGQEDISPAEAREILGPEAIVGLSTHSREQIEAAAEHPVDYISVGPIWETPTKEGRPATGLELIREAARIATRALVRDRRDRRRERRARWSRRARAGSAWCARSGTPTTPRGRQRRWSARSTAGRRTELMGSRERKREERRKRKRRAAERATESATEPANGASSAAEAPESFEERTARRTEERNAAARAELKPLAGGRAPEGGHGRRGRLDGARGRLHCLSGPRRWGRRGRPGRIRAHSRSRSSRSRCG